MAEKDKRNKFNSLVILAIIWLVGASADRIWFALDHSIPAWDQAAHLTGALTFRQALQNPHWFSGDWWTSFWMLSSKFPPLTYIATVPFLNLFGTGPDQSTLVNLPFSAILLACVYGLGTQLFAPQVGLWAAGLCLLLPGLYRVRLDYLLDYPLTALVTLSFWCLTVWRYRVTTNTSSLRSLSWAAAFGISLGLALMVKQTALFFLFAPVLWVASGAIRRRAWGRLLELIGGLLLSAAVFGPWYRTNWLMILTSGQRATVQAAIREGDPALNTLGAWTYYWNQLPEMVSWPLLLVPIVGLFLCWGRSVVRGTGKGEQTQDSGLGTKAFALKWLAVFWVGAYLLSSLNINKDPRYISPYLPALSLFLAYGLTTWTGRWGRHIRSCTVGLAGLLMFLNLLNVGGALFSGLAQILSPNAQHYAYTGHVWPHQQVISEIIQTEPYLRSTLGVLPSTGQINQHNLNYYGAIEDFQVYGRQVGVRRKQVPADARSLSWFLTKTGDQGSVPKEAQAAIVQIVEQGSDHQLHKTWNLPDGSTLKLYHSRVPPVQVQLLQSVSGQSSSIPVQLNRVVVPEKTPPGVPVPVTYEWSGSWEQLLKGLVLLTWRSDVGLKSTSQKPVGAGLADIFVGGQTIRQQNPPLQADSSAVNPKSLIQNPKSSRWLHDRGIGMGALHPEVSTPPSGAGFQVIEQTAMLPGADVAAGTYTLEATYLNRKTGETYPISVPPVTLKIDPASPATPAPELDLVTQLRTLAAGLPKGRDGLAPVFEEIGRINQYDPIQDYLVQAQQALESRLQLEPQNREWAYNLALSRVLLRQVSGAIAALERVTQLDAQNPYAYAYLAFVHLYNWHPKDAQNALKPAFALNPNLPELKALNGIAALMQGNLVQAWHTLRELKIKT